MAVHLRRTAASESDAVDASQEALENLDKDRDFLKAGGVMDDDYIDAYIELKMEEVMRRALHPHSAEFDMDYKC